MKRLRIFSALMYLAIVAVTTVAAAADAPPVREGRLTNLDARPFRFRLARASGAAWTDEIELAPGAALVVRVGNSGAPHELEGITGNGRGHVVIEYRELGGKVRINLPALNVDSGESMPYWFHVKDSNGFGRLVQAPDVEAAKKKQAALLAEPPLTEAEVAKIKSMLRANWVLFD